jgi:dienelactone hydrolase
MHLLEAASPNPLHTKIVDPYAGQRQEFSSEQEAYQRFQVLGGVESYGEILKDAVSTMDGLHTIVGFSAGGAATWKTMEAFKRHSGIELVLFYPGQIRHYLEVENTLPTTIFWPSQEPHFSVTEVIENLRRKQNVQNIHTSFLHGFMNADSAGYSETAYHQYTQYLQARLTAS